MKFLYIFYTFFYFLVLLFFLPKEYFKRPKNLRKKWIKEKFGFLEKSESFSSRECIWIHAVSVGEVISISELVKVLTSYYNVILSTTTDTGQKVALEQFKNLEVKVIYLPFDLPFCIKKVLKTFKPRALLIAETEIWPNLIKITSSFIPVILINARLSERSFKYYKKIKFFIKPIINSFTAIGVQDELYKARFEEIGVNSEKIFITGNVKFDLEVKEIVFDWEFYLKKPVIVAGSTHFPEEKFILKAFLKIFSKEKEGTLLVVPRHPERFEEVERTIKNLLSNYSNILFLKLSDLEREKSFTSNQNVINFNKKVILVDKVGILRYLYRICDIAIIGGSFIPHGGQNPLEAIYWKKTVITGPYMENFPFIEEFVKRGAICKVFLENFTYVLETLIKEENLRKEMAEKAYELFLQKKGAKEKTLKMIFQILGLRL